MNHKSSQVALITGAARRLGRKITETLARNGFKVAIHYRNSSDDAERLAESLNEKYGEKSAKTFQADLDDILQLKKLPGLVHSFFGRLDLLVNNASIFEKIPFDQVSHEDILRFHHTNVAAPAALCVESAKWLRENKPGRIINIVDIYGDYPKKNFLPYTISKAGLKALTRQLAIELAPDILVNAVSPGAILEPSADIEEPKENIINKIPLKRFGTPEDIANTALFLARSNYINGQCITVDGGRSLNI